MKKAILSLAAMALSGVLFAQTHSDLSDNKPNANGEGYLFNFEGSNANNCNAGGGIANFGGITNQTWSVDGNGNLEVTVPVMTAYDDERQIALFYENDCSASPIDLSNTANQKFEINISDCPEAGEMVVVFYSGTQNNYAAPGVNIFTLAPGANTLTATTLDLTGITDKTNITGIAWFFRKSGWPTFGFDFEGVVKISSVKVGDAPAAGSTTSTKAIVSNSLVSVYPNPASNQVNIDLSSLNYNDATVKIINSNGTTVYESKATSDNEVINTSSLLKGMYMVQISAGKNISNKKLIIN